MPVGLIALSSLTVDAPPTRPSIVFIPDDIARSALSRRAASAFGGRRRRSSASSLRNRGISFSLKMSLYAETVSPLPAAAKMELIRELYELQIESERLM